MKAIYTYPTDIVIEAPAGAPIQKSDVISRLPHHCHSSRTTLNAHSCSRHFSHCARTATHGICWQPTRQRHRFQPLRPWRTHPVPRSGQANAKKNANPCRDEVATALTKLRKSSWFRMNTNMITENGPTAMVGRLRAARQNAPEGHADADQPDVGSHSGRRKGLGQPGHGWQELPNDMMNTLRSQMYDNVVQEQTEIGEYACKGKVQVEGRDALSYKLEEEPTKDSTAPKNETFRMFYVDATTGLPLSNALLAPGREKRRCSRPPTPIPST